MQQDDARDPFMNTWRTLGRQLEAQHALDLALLRDARVARARRGLLPLVVGQMLQLLLGIALVALGVSCWTRNMDAGGLLAAGLVVHAFGVLNVAMAGITIGLVATIDYGEPVLRIQASLARLLRVQGLNSALCGLPWWIMWVLVVVAVAGLGGGAGDGGLTPAWIWLSLGVGVAGLLATWVHALRPRRPKAGGPLPDGCDAIRRGQRALDELAAFERDD